MSSISGQKLMVHNLQTISYRQKDGFYLRFSTVEPLKEHFNYENFLGNVVTEPISLVEKNWKENCHNMAGGNGGDCTHYFVSPSEDYIIFQEIIIYIWTSQDNDRPTKTHPSPGPLID